MTCRVRLAGGAPAGREPAIEQVLRVGRAADVGHLFLGRALDQVAVVGGPPLRERADEALAAGEASSEQERRPGAAHGAAAARRKPARTGESRIDGRATRPGAGRARFRRSRSTRSIRSHSQ